MAVVYSEALGSQDSPVWTRRRPSGAVRGPEPQLLVFIALLFHFHWGSGDSCSTPPRDWESSEQGCKR